MCLGLFQECLLTWPPGQGCPTWLLPQQQEPSPAGRWSQQPSLLSPNHCFPVRHRWVGPPPHQPPPVMCTVLLIQPVPFSSKQESLDLFLVCVCEFNYSMKPNLRCVTFVFIFFKRKKKPKWKLCYVTAVVSFSPCCRWALVFIAAQQPFPLHL